MTAEAPPAPDPAPAGGSASSPLRRATVVVAPLLLVAAAGGWVEGLAVARENRYSRQGMAHLAARIVAEEVTRNALLALLVLVPLALLVILLGRWRRGVLAPTLLAWGLAGAWLRLVVSSPVNWRVRRPRLGIELPNLLWQMREAPERSTLVLTPAALAVLGAVAAILLWRRGRRDGRAWPGRRTGMVAWGALALSLATILVAALRPRLGAPPVASTHRSVIWLTWDSTRADHVSTYGYPRETTPELTAIANDAVLYERAYSQHNWTRPSYMSIMTGHQGWEFVLHTGIDRWRATMAEELANAGYHTLGFVQNPNLEFVFRFDQGFDRFVQVRDSERPDTVVDLVARHLDELSPDEPFFLFVHFEGPHWPYETDGCYVRDRDPAAPPPVGADEIEHLLHEHRFDPARWRPGDPEAERRLQYLRDLYDGDIHETDAALGRLVRLLDERGLLRQSLLLFDSDHGDEFLEHGSFGHAHANVHPELTHVPLLARFPDALGVAPRRETAPVANLDLLPTVLDVAGLPIPPDLAGESLLHLDPEEAGRRLIVSSEGGLVAVRRGEWSLVRDYRYGKGPFLYDLAADPDELAPLDSPRTRPAYAELATYADWWGKAIGAKNEGEGLVTPDLPADLQERLKALGYF